MSGRSLRLFWWALALFVPLLTMYSGAYAYAAVTHFGDDVSFTSCPEVIDFGQQGRCVVGVQRLLDADPPHARIYHDGIFGPETLAATREFQSRQGLPATGKADPGTIRMLTRLAPGPVPVPVAAALLTAAITGLIVLARLRPRMSGPG